MRVLLTVRVPTDAGNRGIADGTLPQVVQAFMAKAKPEAAYFTLSEGERTAIFVVDMKDSSELPSLGEPFFSKLNARLTAAPAMNAEELKKGLSAL